MLVARAGGRTSERGGNWPTATTTTTSHQQQQQQSDEPPLASWGPLACSHRLSARPLTRRFVRSSARPPARLATTTSSRSRASPKIVVTQKNCVLLVMKRRARLLDLWRFSLFEPSAVGLSLAATPQPPSSSLPPSLLQPRPPRHRQNLQVAVDGDEDGDVACGNDIDAQRTPTNTTSAKRRVESVTKKDDPKKLQNLRHQKKQNES